jgi:Sec-independent protein translocase protein TatA
MLAEIFGMDGAIVLIIVVVVLFGGAAIPKLARNLGSAKNEFERGLGEGKSAAGAPALAAGNEAVPGRPAEPAVRVIEGSNQKAT